MNEADFITNAKRVSNLGCFTSTQIIKGFKDIASLAIIIDEPEQKTSKAKRINFIKSCLNKQT